MDSLAESAPNATLANRKVVWENRFYIGFQANGITYLAEEFFWIWFPGSYTDETVLGEELVFHGLLLPRMAGVFGKWDWVMNGLLFGLYHLHQPWGILSSAIVGILLFALPSRYFRSSWLGIIAHSGQSIFFTILILGLVLGLA